MEAAVVAGVILLVVGGWLLRREHARNERLIDGLRAELAHDREEATRSVIDATVAIARQQLEATQDRSHEADAGRDAVLTRQMTSMSEELDRVRRLVVDMDQQRRDDQGAVKEQLREAIRNAQLLAETTDGLRAALENSRVRGQWGERMAEDVLRAFGFREGVNYRTQTTTDQGRPDFEILLPDDCSLFMDVKFPLDNYLRWHEADTEDGAEQAATAFVRDARGRIRELADRRYAESVDALSVVLLFLPNDAVLAFVLEREAGLLDEALEAGVLLCSPSTLFGVLAVVRQAMDLFHVDRSSKEILEALAGFQQQWERFTDELDRHGRQLATVNRSFETLTTTRRNQLERSLEQVERLRETQALVGPPERVIALPVTEDDETTAQAS